MTDHFRQQIFPSQSRDVYDFWLAAHGSQRLPKQSDLNLMSIPKLVPGCFILDAVSDRRFRYRFVGTAIDAHIGVPLTGRMIDEVRRGKLLETLTELYGTTQKTERAGFATTHMPADTRNHMLYHRLSLPLSDNRKTVDKIFGCHFFELAATAEFERPYIESSGEDEISRVKMIFRET